MQNHQNFDGYSTKLIINETYENDNLIILETSNSQTNKLYPIILLILKKLNLKETDFYR